MGQKVVNLASQGPKLHIRHTSCGPTTRAFKATDAAPRPIIEKRERWRKCPKWCVVLYALWLLPAHRGVRMKGAYYQFGISPPPPDAGWGWPQNNERRREEGSRKQCERDGAGRAF